MSAAVAAEVPASASTATAPTKVLFMVPPFAKVGMPSLRGEQSLTHQSPEGCIIPATPRKNRHTQMVRAGAEGALKSAVLACIKRHCARQTAATVTRDGRLLAPQRRMDLGSAQ